MTSSVSFLDHLWLGGIGNVLRVKWSGGLVLQCGPRAKPRWGSGAKPPEAEHFFTNYKKF